MCEAGLAGSGERTTSGLSCECSDGGLEFADLSSKLFNLRRELWERSSGGSNGWGMRSYLHYLVSQLSQLFKIGGVAG